MRKSEENFFVGWRASARGGGAASLVPFKVGSREVYNYSTNKELKGFFGGYKRTAQSADQGFFGGIAREFRISGAQARSVFSPRRRCEPKISLAQTFFAKRSSSEAFYSHVIS